MTSLKALPVIIALAAAPTVEATIAFQIYQIGLADEEGVATNGMYLGFIVDTDRNGFNFGQYTPFDLDINGQFLPSSTGASDDYYFLPSATSEPREVTKAGGPLGNGAVGEYNSIPFLEGVFSPNDPFALVWFVTNTSDLGSNYGILRANNWVLPPDNGVFSEDNDLIDGTLAAQYVIVPEPSTYTLAFGLLAFSAVLIRRRVKQA